VWCKASVIPTQSGYPNRGPAPKSQGRTRIRSVVCRLIAARLYCLARSDRGFAGAVAPYGWSETGSHAFEVERSPTVTNLVRRQ
jgi:hypothetical protein